MEKESEGGAWTRNWRGTSDFFSIWSCIRGAGGDKTKRTVTQRNNPSSVPSCFCSFSLLPFLSPISTDSCWDRVAVQFADIIGYIQSVLHCNVPQHKDNHFRPVHFSVPVWLLAQSISKYCLRFWLLPTFLLFHYATWRFLHSKRN